MGGARDQRQRGRPAPVAPAPPEPVTAAGPHLPGGPARPPAGRAPSHRVRVLVAPATSPAAAVEVVVSGEVHFDTAGELGARVDDAIALASRRRAELRLRLDDARFVGIVALQALVDAHERARARGVTMTIDSASPATRRLLAATGLEERFGFAHDESDEHPRGW